MKGLIEFFVKQKVFGNLLTVVTIVLGIASMVLIRREVFPTVNFDIITVTTILPGASATQTEKLLTNPLEQDLKEVEGIKKLRSTSAENRSYIEVWLDPDQTTEEKGKSDVQDVVDRFTDLPDGAQKPVVTAVSTKLTPIIEVSVSSQVSDLELRKIAKRFEKELELVSGVARVEPRGLRDLEIRVELDLQKLARLRISLNDVILALKRQNLTVPGGVIEAESGEKLIRASGEFKSVEDVEATVIRANELASAIRIRDVARVYYDLQKPEILNRTNAKDSISLTILKKETGDAITVVDQVKERVDALKARYPQVEIEYVNDLSTFIRRRISILGSNLLIGLVLVLGILSLILQRRIALIVSIGIPFSFLGCMIIFYNWDYTINLISLLGLIIVSGMLIDDAIVVTDNAARLIDEGVDPETAAVEGTSQVWQAVTASVLTTVTAFLPMMFMSGIFGKFVKQIPLGVVFALLISLFEAFLILPAHLAAWAPSKKQLDAEKAIKKPGRLDRFLDRSSRFWDDAIVPRYLKFLKRAVERRYRSIAAIGALFIGTLMLAVFGMKFILFPPDGIEIFFVRAQAPVGTSLTRMAEIMKPLEAEIAKLPAVELERFVTNVGIQQEEPNDPNTKRGSEFAQIAVYLTPEEGRTRTAAEIIESLRSGVTKPEGLERLTYDRASGGPPVGKPISVGVRADEYEEIIPAMEALKKRIAKLDGVKDVTDSLIRGKPELTVEMQSAEAAAAGVSIDAIGAGLNVAYEGMEATKIRTLDEEVVVRVALPKKDRSTEATLGKVLVSNPMGNLVPLDEVARITRGQGLAVYTHEANLREVRVFGDVDTEVTTATAANAEIRKFLPEFQKEFPGVTFGFGGEDEDTQESMASLGRAFIVAFLGIFLILVATFKQILQPMLVVVTIPLGMMAVIWALFVHGMPLSFMAMLGIIALAGVIVNNAIIFIDFVNQERLAGVDRFTSIYNAAQMRIRPIFLTTITTVLGLMPTAYGIGGLDAFVVPIAMALGWGLVFGSVLTAFVIPVALSILDDIESRFARFLPKKS